MRDLTEINVNFAGKKVDGLSLTESEIASLQQKLGVTFPENYLAFLRFANGGQPAWSSFPFHDEEGTYDAGVTVDMLFALTRDEGAWVKQNVLSQTLLLRNILREEAGIERPVVAIGSTGSGMIFMDCEPDNNRVYLFFLTSETDEDIVVPVADSFEQFIDSLYLDPELV